MISDELEGLRAERRLWNSEAAALEAKAANARRQAILCDRRMAEIEGREIKPDPLMRDELRDGRWIMDRRRPLASAFLMDS